jgi:hypothetical protein
MPKLGPLKKRLTERERFEIEKAFRGLAEDRALNRCTATVPESTYRSEHRCEKKHNIRGGRCPHHFESKEI